MIREICEDVVVGGTICGAIFLLSLFSIVAVIAFVIAFAIVLLYFEAKRLIRRNKE